MAGERVLELWVDFEICVGSYLEDMRFDARPLGEGKSNNPKHKGQVIPSWCSLPLQLRVGAAAWQCLNFKVLSAIMGSPKGTMRVP